jgi:PAS domain-containing protein
VAYDVEVILVRQVASYLAMPIFVVDPDGNLIYFNEPAEKLLGRRYDETGEMTADEWSRVFLPTDPEGKELPPERLPLMVALTQQRPDHSRFSIQGLDGVAHDLSVTALPLIGQQERLIGAVAIFWEEELT